MTRRLLIPALASVVAAMLGCVRSNHGSVQLSDLCTNPTPTTGGCAFSAGTCGQVNAEGFLKADLALTGNTLLYPIQIDNQRPDNSDLTAGRTNTNNAFIERFDMRYTGPGVNLTASFPQSATVPSAGSVVVVVALIPSNAGAALASAIGSGPVTVAINVKAHGRYGDDTEFDTAEFSIPATLSQGTAVPFACTGTNAGKTPACCPDNGTATKGGQTSACTCL
jgi:hypothetical protein